MERYFSHKPCLKSCNFWKIHSRPAIWNQRTFFSVSFVCCPHIYLCWESLSLYWRHQCMCTPLRPTLTHRGFVDAHACNPFTSTATATPTAPSPKPTDPSLFGPLNLCGQFFGQSLSERFCLSFTKSPPRCYGCFWYSCILILLPKLPTCKKVKARRSKLLAYSLCTPDCGAEFRCLGRRSWAGAGGCHKSAKTHR